MRDIKFQELKTDDVFTLNGKQYKKIVDKKVSCCKILNAANTADPSEVIQIKPLTTVVQVND